MDGDEKRREEDMELRKGRRERETEEKGTVGGKEWEERRAGEEMVCERKNKRNGKEELEEGRCYGRDKRGRTGEGGLAGWSKGREESEARRIGKVDGGEPGKKKERREAKEGEKRMKRRRNEKAERKLDFVSKKRIESMKRGMWKEEEGKRGKELVKLWIENEKEGREGKRREKRKGKDRGG